MTRYAVVAATPGSVMSEPGRFWDAGTALEQVYAVHWRPLVRLAVLLVGDQATAEEVVQDAFVAMHDRWSRLRDPDKALAYLRRTVVNRARSELRHRRVVVRELRRLAARPQAQGQPADTPTWEHARRDAVVAAMLTLPRRQREVLALRYYLDLSESQIAATLGISNGAVKSHASRGAAALRTELAGFLEESR